MYTLTAPLHFVRTLASSRVTAGCLTVVALLSAACADSASNLTAPLPSPSPIIGSFADASKFAVLAKDAVLCTDGAITGDVGTFSVAPTASVTQSSCPIVGTVRMGEEVAQQAFEYFLSAHAALAPKPGDVCTTLTGTLAGVTLSPGIYCFAAAATLTGVLTLEGPADGLFIFKVGASGSGALTATNLTVVLAGGAKAQNVAWYVADAATLTTSAFQGSLLAGTAITLTGGSVNGNAWAKGVVTITGTAVNGSLSAVIPVAFITVAPDSAALLANGTTQFSAIGTDANGHVVAITPVWSVVNGGGSIEPHTGLFTAGAGAGTFSSTIRASSGAIAGTATVIVTAIAPPPAVVNLGSAAPNGIMAGTAVRCVIGGIVNGDVSIAPGNTLTGFGPCVITGAQHLGDSVAAQGQLDLTSAYDLLAGLACGATISADLGGTTQAAGVYCSASSIGVTGTLTLDGAGDPNARFVFQAGSALTTAGQIVLINGAQAKNVYWQVGSSATLGTGSQWQGTILAMTSITLVDEAQLVGRALARIGAVSLGTNSVITLP